MTLLPMRQHLNDYPLVIVHNYLESFRKFLSRSKDENTLLDRRFNGDQALFWLGDPKLVISSAKIENAGALLKRWGYPNTKTLAPRNMSASLSEDILSEAALHQAIIAAAGEEKKVALVPYATTTEFLRLAYTLRENFGLEVFLPESTTPEDLWVKDYLDSKVGFRSLVSQIAANGGPLNIPQGFTCPELPQAVEAADWFRRRGKGCVVKANIGGSGVGNLFLPIETIPTKESISRQINHNQFLTDDIFVVEEFILSPEMISPSMEFYLPPSGQGAPQFTYLCNQLFETSGRFAGVVISKELEESAWWPGFYKQGMRIAHALQQIGYAGYFDLDSVVDAEDNCFMVEINSRRTGGTYAHEFMEHFFGIDYGDRFSVLSQNKQHAGKLRSLESLETAIGGLLYPIQEQERGVIVMLTSTLPSGYFGYLIVGNSIEDCSTIQTRMSALIQAA